MLWQFLLCIGLLISLFLFPKASHYGAEQGISIFLDTLLPYLLPYLLLTTWLFALLQRSNASVRSAFIIAYITSAIGGYPIGAIATCSLYSQQIITKKQALWLLPFLHSPNPFFVINFVGVDLLNDISFSIYYLVLHHAISISAVWMIYRRVSRTSVPHPPSKPPTVQSVLEQTASTTMTIAITIIFFSSFTYISAELLKHQVPISITSIVIGAFELTNGLQFASSYLDSSYLPLYFAFLISSQSISIHVQVASITTAHKLSLSPYFFTRFLYTLFFTVLYAFLY